MLKMRSRLLTGLMMSAAAVLFSLGGLRGASAGGVGGSVGVNASVTLTPDFPIFESAPLVFGSAVIGGGPGIISMSTDSDAVTFSGSVSSVDQTTAHRGSFFFIAPVIGTYQVTIPARTQMALVEDPTQTIQLAPAVSVLTPVTTVVDEVVDVFVGGTITLGANTPTGAYTGVVVVEVVCT